jgi:hypothetical protein
MEIALILFVIAVIFITRSIKVVPQQNAWVVERLGKYHGSLTPGLNFLVPFIDRVAYKHSLKEIPLDVPSQVCITRDNTQLQVDGILYFQVTDPMRASYGSSNYIVASRSWPRPRCAQRDRQAGTGQDLRGARHHQRAGGAGHRRGRAELGREGAALRDQGPDAAQGDPARHAAQITAEREKRALIAASEGRRQEQINIATGEREAFIARSEGEKQAAINNAQGEAASITGRGRRHRPGDRAHRRGHPPAGRRAGGAAQGGRKAVEAYGKVPPTPPPR